MYCDDLLSVYFEPRPLNMDSSNPQDEDGVVVGKEAGPGPSGGVASIGTASGGQEQQGFGRGTDAVVRGMYRAKADSTGVAGGTSPLVRRATLDSTVTSQPVGAVSGGVSGCEGRQEEDGGVGIGGGKTVEGDIVALGGNLGVRESVDGNDKVSTDAATSPLTHVTEVRLGSAPDDKTRSTFNGGSDSVDAEGVLTGQTDSGCSTDKGSTETSNSESGGTYGSGAITGSGHSDLKNGLPGTICNAVGANGGTTAQDGAAISNGGSTLILSNGSACSPGEGNGHLSSRLSDHDFHESLHVFRSESVTAPQDKVGKGVGPGRGQATPTRVPDSGPSIHDDEYLTLSPAFSRHGIPAAGMLEMLPMQGVSSPAQEGGSVVAGLVEAAQDTGCGQEGAKQCDVPTTSSRPSLTSNEDTAVTQ